MSHHCPDMKRSTGSTLLNTTTLHSYVMCHTVPYCSRKLEAIIEKTPRNIENV